MKKLLSLLFACSLLAVPHSSFAQTKDELEKKKDDLLKEISSMQKELDKTKSDKTANMNQLYSLQQKITVRESLIGTYSEQIGSIDLELDNTKKRISSLEDQVSKLKNDYAAMVVYAYKHRSSYSKLLFIFSAKNFNDALRRLRYVKKINAYRKSQVGLIKLTQNDLASTIEALKFSKKEKTKVVDEQMIQKDQLLKERKQKDKLVKDLTKQEKNLLAEINAKKKEQKKLNKQIEDAIKKEIEGNKPKPVAGNKNTNSNIKPSVTPEIKEMSASFVANQGKFPWPVEVGNVVESFGTHPHPVLNGVTTKNNGVDIKTEQGAGVRTVFKGTVVSVITNPTYHKAVIIKHGEYFTVYSNLLSVNVKAGDVVETKQKIGTAFTDLTGFTMVHFELWNGTVLQDPESWLAGK